MNTELVMIVFLLAYIVYADLRNWYERKNLMDRLFARDLPELVTLELERKRSSHPHKLSPMQGFEV